MLILSLFKKYPNSEAYIIQDEKNQILFLMIKMKQNKE